MKTVGDLMRERRQRLGISRQAASAQAGFSFTALSNWETGRNSPTVAALAAIAAVYGCHPAEFLPVEHPVGDGPVGLVVNGCRHEFGGNMRFVGRFRRPDGSIEFRFAAES